MEDRSNSKMDGGGAKNNSPAKRKRVVDSTSILNLDNLDVNALKKLQGEQLDRFEAYRRSAIPRAAMKKVDYLAGGGPETILKKREKGKKEYSHKPVFFLFVYLFASSPAVALICDGPSSRHQFDYRGVWCGQAPGGRACGDREEALKGERPRGGQTLEGGGFQESLRLYLARNATSHQEKPQENHVRVGTIVSML
jgi:hypothetical protein